MKMQVNFVTEHVIGIAKDCDDEMKKDLNAHFMGETTSRHVFVEQTDREVILGAKHLNVMQLKKQNIVRDLRNC